MKKVATTIKIETGVYDQFKILGIQNKLNLQTVAENCVTRYVTDKEFRNNVNKSISSSKFSDLNYSTSGNLLLDSQRNVETLLLDQIVAFTSSFTTESIIHPLPEQQSLTASGPLGDIPDFALTELSSSLAN